MRTAAVLLLFILASSPATAQPAPDFASSFTTRTMRVDYFHTGGMGTEIFSLDRVLDDGEWAGSRTRLLDDTNLGKYRFEVIDEAGSRPIYSRGLASIYGEWETTAEARGSHRTFHESLRLPWPKRRVRIALSKRQPDQSFTEVWSTVVDPDSRFVNRARLEPLGTVWTVFEHGDPSEKVDIVILADGYTAAERDKFHADVQRLVATLFEVEPFKSRRRDFNVRAVDLASSESGIHRTRGNAPRRTPLSMEFNIFDVERYALTFDNRRMRDIASAAPYEFIEILGNDRTYGGGGIFNDHATATVDSAYSVYVFIHEFAHHFAALADEYYTSDVAYETGAARHPEPWEPNVTAMHDAAALKWRDLVAAGTPLPTPWDKGAYEQKSRDFQERRRKLRERGAPETEMNALFREQENWEKAFLSGEKYAGMVGAFEGAAYEVNGLYRPELDCIMFTRNPVGFCRVCRRGIERIIDLYASR
ncbi:MAG TPA: M64 family metallopeptidase [Vicinamibacterales bacterium]|nr:M64 family metallopeptidase [Vicinamibacterales bacterium]